MTNEYSPANKNQLCGTFYYHQSIHTIEESPNTKTENPDLVWSVLLLHNL
jgi:hypothetical protein